MASYWFPNLVLPKIKNVSFAKLQVK